MMNTLYLPADKYQWRSFNSILIDESSMTDIINFIENYRKNYKALHYSIDISKDSCILNLSGYDKICENTIAFIQDLCKITNQNIAIHLYIFSVEKIKAISYIITQSGVKDIISLDSITSTLLEV